MKYNIQEIQNNKLDKIVEKKSDQKNTKSNNNNDLYEIDILDHSTNVTGLDTDATTSNNSDNDLIEYNIVLAQDSESIFYDNNDVDDKKNNKVKFKNIVRVKLFFKDEILYDNDSQEYYSHRVDQAGKSILKINIVSDDDKSCKKMFKRSKACWNLNKMASDFKKLNQDSDSDISEYDVNQITQNIVYEPIIENIEGKIFDKIGDVEDIF